MGGHDVFVELRCGNQVLLSLHVHKMREVHAGIYLFSKYCKLKAGFPPPVCRPDVLFCRSSRCHPWGSEIVVTNRVLFYSVATVSPRIEGNR